MILTVAESRKYLEGYYDLVIDDSQFQILDESVCIWFAYAHKRTSGMSFPMVVRERTYIELTSTAVLNFMQDS